MFHARARQDSGSHISGHNSPAARADRSGLSKRLKNTVLKPFVVQKQYQHCQCVVFFARFTGENFVWRRPPDHRLRFLRRIFYEKLQNWFDGQDVVAFHQATKSEENGTVRRTS